MPLETHRRRGWPVPFHDLQRLQDEINRLHHDAGMAEFPPINLWTREQGLLLMAEVPGVDPDQLDVTVHDDTLMLKGQRTLNTAADEVTYHRRECGDGTFGRTVALPYRVAVDQVEAKIENGVLTVMLPRHEDERPKRIAINRA